MNIIAKMNQILKNNKGFTLTEISVSLVVLSFFLLVVTSIVSSILFQFLYANNFARLNGFMNTIAIEVTNDINKATDPITIPTPPNAFTIHIGPPNGIRYEMGEAGTENENFLMRQYLGTVAPIDPAPVFPRNFYRNKQIENFALAEDDGVYTLTLKVRDTRFRNLMLEREYAIRPLIAATP